MTGVLSSLCILFTLLKMKDMVRYKATVNAEIRRNLISTVIAQNLPRSKHFNNPN